MLIGVPAIIEPGAEREDFSTIGVKGVPKFLVWAADVGVAGAADTDTTVLFALNEPEDFALEAKPDCL
jgi:hypothetical protein